MARDNQRQAHELRELATQYSGWRFGVGGSGHWWAVRRNEFIRALSPEQLRDALQRHLASVQET